MNRPPPPMVARPHHRIKSEDGIKLPPPQPGIHAAENIGTYLSLVHPRGGRACPYHLSVDCCPVTSIQGVADTAYSCNPARPRYAAPCITIRGALRAMPSPSDVSDNLTKSKNRTWPRMGYRNLNGSRTPRMRPILCSEMNFRQIRFPETQQA